mgnify:CR=1 FL=1
MNRYVIQTARCESRRVVSAPGFEPEWSDVPWKAPHRNKRQAYQQLLEEAPLLKPDIVMVRIVRRTPAGEETVVHGPFLAGNYRDASTTPKM